MTLSGAISGGFGLIKILNGTLVLSGTNTYTGGTTVSAGNLDVKNTGTLGTSDVALTGGATLTLEGTNGIGAAANLVLNTSAVVTNSFTGTNTIAGLSFDGGTTFQAIGTWGTNSAAHTNTVFFKGPGKLNVLGAATTTILASSANPSTYGQSVTFTATVSSISGTPSGTVQFRTNGVAFSTTALSGGSASSAAISTLPAGSVAVTAVYSGDSTYAGSTGTLSGGQAVNKATPVLSWSNPADITFGTALSGTQLNATAGGVSGSFVYTPASGTILNAGSGQNLSVQFTPTDTADYNSPVTTNVTINVNKASQTITFGALPAKTYGNPVFGLVATATSGLTVSFASSDPTVASVSGTNVTILKAGSTTITASQAGNGNYNAATSVPQTLTVNPANSGTAIVAASNPSVFGQSGVTFTATVTNSSPGSTGTPTGTVQFQTNSVNFGSAVTLAGGTATSGGLPANLPPGSYTVTAAYSGDTNFNTSSGTLAGGQTINKAAPSVAVSSSSNPSVYGQTGVSFTATVSSSAGTPGGSVQFQTNGVNFGGTVTLVPFAGNTANSGFLPTNLPPGNYTVTATYGGDSNFSTNTSSLSGGQTISKASTSTTVTSPVANPSVYGQSGVTFHAVVSATSPGAGTPTGTVQFRTNSVDFGSAVSLSGGAADSSALPTTLPTNSYAITAVYNGDSNFATNTSGTLTQTINKAAPSVAVSSSSNPSAYGQIGVSYTATVSSPAGTPGGSVQFQTNGVNFGGTVTLVPFAGNTANSGFLPTNLPPGNYTVTATYGGDSNFSTNTGSLSGGQTINPTGLTIKANNDTKTYGQSKTYGAGSTAFTSSGLKNGESIGSVTLTASGGTATNAAAGTYTLTPSAATGGTFNPGNYAITYSNGTLTVGQATVTPTVTLNNKTYDGTNSATTVASRSLSGVVGSDDVNLGASGTVAAFGSKNVNAYTGIAITGLSLSGTTAGNYQLSASATTASASITARTLTVTATGVNKPYDGTTNATVTLADDRVTGDVFTDNYTNASFSDKNTGTGKTVTVTGISISGTDAGNYSPAATTATATADITAAASPITVVSSLNPSGYKAGVFFTATNLPADASGSVVFLTNSVAFSTNTLSSGGTVSLTLTNLPRGTNVITAQYAGDSNYAGATNLLAGGQIVTNHPPVAGDVSYTRSAVSIRLSLSLLFTNVTDADGDTITLASAGPSTNLVTLATNSQFILYLNTNGVNDKFSYTVSDGFGGSATGTITMNYYPFKVGQNGTVSVSGGVASLAFNAIPNFRYGIERSTNLVDWTLISVTNAPGNGAFYYDDNFSDLGSNAPASAYYRLQWNP